MRAPVLYWIAIVYLAATLLYSVFNYWLLFSVYRTFALASVLPHLILFGAHLLSKTAAIAALLARKNIAAYLLAGSLAAIGADMAWYIVGMGRLFDAGSIMFVWLPTFAIALLVVLYAFRLKRNGFLKPWREPGPASVFD